MDRRRPGNSNFANNQIQAALSLPAVISINLNASPDRVRPYQIMLLGDDRLATQFEREVTSNANNSNLEGQRLFNRTRAPRSYQDQNNTQYRLACADVLANYIRHGFASEFGHFALFFGTDITPATSHRILSQQNHRFYQVVFDSENYSISFTEINGHVGIQAPSQSISIANANMMFNQLLTLIQEKRNELLEHHAIRIRTPSPIRDDYA